MYKALLLAFLLIFAISCENETHLRLVTDQDISGDTDQPTSDDTAVVPDDHDTTGPDQNDAATPDDDLSVPCELDSECGDGEICVLGNCAPGCKADKDCAAYPGTTCNTETNRCLNETANDGACSEKNCPTGCCWAERGFVTLKCLIPPAVKYCGTCAQGEVYMGQNTCVPAACSTKDTLCQTYNSYDSRAACYECKTGDLLCYDNPACN
ncbi:MAG TPA: hypothetical protein PLV42_09775 [bacterium]|nr:hypothetical protein [bacterium]